MPKYDYSQAGAYFVTICTQNRKCLFGQILNNQMELNDAGIFVSKCWLEIPNHFPHATLDEFVIMPNHVHGIIILANNPAGANDYSPLPYSPVTFSPLHHRPTETSKTIGSIIRWFKIGVTKGLRGKFPGIQPWQRNYYEHVIRNENDLNQTRQYVISKSLNWSRDENYTADGNEIS